MMNAFLKTNFIKTLIPERFITAGFRSYQKKITQKDRMLTIMDKLVKKGNRRELVESRYKPRPIPTFSENDLYVLPPTTISKNILFKQNRVAKILKENIQDLLSSGAIGDEDYYLNGVQITNIIHRNKSNCFVLWDSVDKSEVEEINLFLNNMSKKIRHILMHSHVISQVPHLYFRVDSDKIFHDDVLSGLGVHLDVIDKDYDKDLQYLNVEGTSKTVKLETFEKNLCNDMFKVDQLNLMDKVKMLKKKTNT